MNSSFHKLSMEKYLHTNTELGCIRRQKKRKELISEIQVQQYEDSRDKNLAWT
ncbi:MAG: hypothetical protein JWP88_2049 [Flaviaesturariibacter sp.]|nr:hypothetical protein [Flaviaesturariibacter sp.]